MPSQSAAPPAYTSTPRSSITRRPLVFQLRQVNHKQQVIVPIGTGAATLGSYTIKKKSGASLSRSPKFILIKDEPASRASSTVAHVCNAAGSSFPYVPRFAINYLDSPRRSSIIPSDSTRQEMTLANFRTLQWKFLLSGRPHAWSVMRPPAASAATQGAATAALALVDEESGIIRATFVYSAMGTTAKGGAEVGRFEVATEELPSAALQTCSSRSSFSSSSTASPDDEDAAFLEQLFFTAVVAIAYARDSGRVLFNRPGGPTSVRSPTYCGEDMPPPGPFIT